MPINEVQGMDPFSAALAAAPEAGTRQTYDQGITPPLRGEGEEQEPSKTLQDSPPDVTFQTVEGLVRGQDALTRSRYAIDTYYRWIDAGIVNGRLSKVPNRNMYVAKLPPGASESKAAVPNKANDLNNKFTEQLLADPPKPAARAKVNNTGTKEVAELANRFLRIDGGATGTNDIENLRWAIRNATTGASSFLLYEVDKTGGGSRALQVMAAPNAQDVANPLVEITQDPMTGQPLESRSSNPILRYVSAPTPEAPAGMFVETEAEADRVWVPKIVSKRIRREQVKTYPPTAAVHDAQAVIVLDWIAVSDGMRKWPDTVGKMSGEQLASLAGWRPALYDIVTPFIFRTGMTDTGSGPGVEDVGSFSALMQKKMYFYRMYIKPCPEYPEGLALDISGLEGGTILRRETMDFTVPAEEGEEIRSRDIPIAQITPNLDETDMDPFGLPYSSRFAQSAEAAAALYAAFLDLTNQRLHPHVYIRSTAPIDDNDWLSRDGLPKILNPQDPEPSYEQFPIVPDIPGIVGVIHQQQDVASGLTAAAQGLDTPTATSGVAKGQVLQQAKISLQLALQQMLSAQTRIWRIKLQIAQADFDDAQLLKYTGEDGSSEVVWLKAADLATIDDVGIEPGTGTLMTAEGKASYVSYMQQNQWIDPITASQVATIGLAGDLGLPPSPAKQAIDRAISSWLEGPDPAWQVQFQQFQVEQEAFQQRAIQQMEAYRGEATQYIEQGAPPPPPPDVGQPPQMPLGPLAPKPNDTDPQVATAWMKALSDLMFNPQYDAQPPEWQQVVNQKYESCRMAMTPPAPPPGVGGPPQGQPSPSGI